MIIFVHLFWYKDNAQQHRTLGLKPQHSGNFPNDVMGLEKVVYRGHVGYHTHPNMKMGISSLNNTTNNLVRTNQTPCLSLYHCFKTRQVDSWANHAYWELTHYLAEYVNVIHKLSLLLLVSSLLHKMYVSDWFGV